MSCLKLGIIHKVCTQIFSEKWYYLHPDLHLHILNTWPLTSSWRKKKIKENIGIRFTRIVHGTCKCQSFRLYRSHNLILLFGNSRTSFASVTPQTLIPCQILIKRKVRYFFFTNNGHAETWPDTFHHPYFVDLPIFNTSDIVFPCNVRAAYKRIS